VKKRKEEVWEKESRRQLNLGLGIVVTLGCFQSGAAMPADERCH
jgi:hypothetical protein